MERLIIDTGVLVALERGGSPVAETIPYDLLVARQHAHLLAHTRRAGRPRGAHDLQIAATAAATRRTVVTTDADAFDGLPGIDVRLVGWF